MLLCIHFSEQLKLVSLDIDKRSFEFEPKDLVMPESFVPVYIDGYISKQHKVNPFLINLFFKDSSSNWYSNYFIFKNGKFVNLDTPWKTRVDEKIIEGSETYYNVYNMDGHLIINEYFPKHIFEDNLITKDGSNIGQVDMKSLQIKLKLKLESGSIISYTAEYEGSLPKESYCLRWFCCCMKKSTEGPYRYKLFSGSVGNE
ncbi:hypothetical protein BdWA1_002908 [Babesia duncani]|uniref:Uncharacterized protein n=1 Tax=Babesia duncani TaxID=323732 RepID=A0AAD9PGQ3_9APIC|nr:hypothetical protein BdWA1_004104 [Babesia duncani]KAK2194595.1 hypothetical protein BdWA1_003933 [Babesia duncani]KAK2195235.1 hypothetical protein BdWA1_002908 [Babesia duncani]